jgi:hypothetical protein
LPAGDNRRKLYRCSSLGLQCGRCHSAAYSRSDGSTGFIEGIGTISSTVAAPAVGLAVIKSGRTTGTTTGSIASINTSVKVQYQVGCGEGKNYFVNYTNQVLINSTTFSAGGDSGSLIVSNDSNFNPVALLFAGSSSTTIANPIGEVLTKVGTTLGKSVSFVGGGGGGDMGSRSPVVIASLVFQTKQLSTRAECWNRTAMI